MDKFKLGSKIRCKVTGLEGIATARIEYINGCIQYCLTPKSDGTKYPESNYLDQKQLEQIDGGIEMDAEDTGGPMINCPRH